VNDQHEPGPDDVDDPDHAWVRDLLGDARVAEPVPDDVAARLDQTLAALQAERAASRGPAPDESPTVVPLRRRLPARLTAAAAAVIVLGAGGVAIAQLGGNGSGGSGDASSKAADSVASGSPTAPRSVGGAAPQALADAAVPRLTAASFASDAARVMRQVAALDGLAGTASGFAAASPTAPAPAQTPADQSPEAAKSSGLDTGALQAPAITATPPPAEQDLRSPAACAAPAPADGITLQATLDGTPVALVFRPPTADGQRVEAWSCDGTTLLRSALIAQ
jgi:hypothetical protein